MHETIYDLYRQSGISIVHDVGFSIKFTSSAFAIVTCTGRITATLKQVGPNQAIWHVQTMQPKAMSFDEVRALFKALQGENTALDDSFKQVCAIALEGR